MLRKPFLILLILLCFAGAIHAQATCPPAVLIDLSRSASACYNLTNEQLCVGNGSATVSTTAANGAAQPGDHFDTAEVRGVQLIPSDDDLPTAYVTVRANLAESNHAMLLLFGEVTLTNPVDFPTVTLNVVARGTVILRAQPSTSGAELSRIGVNGGTAVDGRTNDGAWLRTLIDGTQAAWLAASGVTVQGDLNQLMVIDPAAEVLRPLQHMTLATGGAAFCDGAFTSGALLQTPNLETPLELQINGVDVSLAGTFYLQADPVLTVYALHGQGMIGGEFVTAGAFARVGESAAPYDSTVVNGLPINNLPIRVVIAAPTTPEAIEAARQAYLAAQAEAAATPIPITPVDRTCRRRVIRITTLYGGPGDFYEAINDIAEGTLVTPILQTNDPDGNVWWQLNNSNWILAARVQQTGECPPIPVAQVAPTPTTNELSLETCESINGPLRSGQRVTIRFTPPPFDNYGEARDAVRVDPGRIVIGARTYRASATEPIRLGTADERYLRRFYLVWTAEPGTYRIEGYRLHYNPICTITVPVG